MTVQPKTAKCDSCGKSRFDDTNHWITVLVDQDDPNGACFYVWKELILEPTSGRNQYFHACGLECATKLFQRWFTEGKL